MNKKWIAALITGVGMTTHPCIASDADNLKEQLANIQSLYAQFEQKVTDVNGKIIQNGHGVFALSNPGKLYWNLTEPDESLIVAKKNTVWVYNPFAEEVTILDLEQATAASPMTLLIHRDQATWKQYTVKKINGCYDIKPIKDQGTVTQVTACFSDKQLKKFVIHDAQGNNSSFLLAKQRSLSPEESNLFDFVPPKDVDIDDQRPQSE